MPDRPKQVYETALDPKIMAMFERSQKAQDAVMAVVGGKRRVGARWSALSAAAVP